MEAKQAYWKILATFASWMVLGGFLVFPLAFEGQQGTIRSSRAALLTVAVSLTSFGYLMSLLLCFSITHRALLLDHVFVPCLSSSVLGLFNVVLNILLRDLVPLGDVTTVAIALSTISTGCYAAAAVYHLMSFEPNFSFRPERKQNNSLWSDDGTALITEDDLQRQQLQNLLKQTANRSPSPEISQNTYRIDLPEDTSDSRGRTERYLAVPQNTYSRSSSKTPSITIEESPSSWEMNSLRPHDATGHNRSSSWGL